LAIATRESEAWVVQPGIHPQVLHPTAE
jgi:hypothetical protein